MNCERSSRKRLRAIMLALPCLAFLPSCGKEIVVQRVPVPEKWLTCAAQPKAPDEDTDKAVATFIVDLIAAGEDCRATVAAIKAWNKQ